MLKVSVIIPSFRPGDYILNCIDSLYQQSLSFSDFEVIIVLNGEKNPYYNFIVEKIKRINDFNFDIKVVYTELKGVSNARNIGLELSNGEYITFLDDDDDISDNFLHGLLESIFDNYSIVVSNIKKINANTGNEMESYIAKAYSDFKKLNCKNKINDSFSLIRYRKFFSNVCGKLIPVEVISNDRFDVSQIVGEDAFFMAKISYRVSDIIFAPENCIYYINAREGSLSRNEESRLAVFKKRVPLIFDYLNLYFSGIKKYNFIFFITRILATIKVMIQ